MTNPTDHTVPVSLLFPSGASAVESLGIDNLDRSWTATLHEGLKIDGQPQLKTSGFIGSEILVQAAITIGSGITVNIAAALLSEWLRKCHSRATIRIGKQVIPASTPEIKEAVHKALQVLVKG